MSKKAAYKAGIITLSDKGSKGQRVDESGSLLEEMLSNSGDYEVVYRNIMADEQENLEKELRYLCDDMELDVIFTTGGTGFSDRDITPEATLAVATRQAPGIAEYMRYKSMEITPRAMLSRGVSVIRNHTLIINLPGSPKGVRENLGFIMPSLNHGLDILLGKTGECGKK